MGKNKKKGKGRGGVGRGRGGGQDNLSTPGKREEADNVADREEKGIVSEEKAASGASCAPPKGDTPSSSTAADEKPGASCSVSKGASSSTAADEKPGASCSVSKDKTASSSTAAEEKSAGASCAASKGTVEEKQHKPEVPKERCPSSAADEKQGLSCSTPTAKSSSKAKQHSSGAKVKGNLIS